MRKSTMGTSPPLLLRSGRRPPLLVPEQILPVQRPEQRSGPLQQPGFLGKSSDPAQLSAWILAASSLAKSRAACAGLQPVTANPGSEGWGEAARSNPRAGLWMLPWVATGRNRLAKTAASDPVHRTCGSRMDALLHERHARECGHPCQPKSTRSHMLAMGSRLRGNDAAVWPLSREAFARTHEAEQAPGFASLQKRAPSFLLYRASLSENRFTLFQRTPAAANRQR